MNLESYLNPVNFSSFRYPEWVRESSCLGTLLRKNQISLPLKESRLVIIGLPEDRNALQKGSQCAPDAIRQQLYLLNRIAPGLQLLDLGNLRQGKAIQDSYSALEAVCRYFRNEAIPILFLGGSQDLILPIARSMQGEAYHLVTIDSLPDFDPEDVVLHSGNYLSQLWNESDEKARYTIMGYQNYLVDDSELDQIREHHTELIRLGNLRPRLDEAEPFLRDADILSFDLQALRYSDAPGQLIASPNGFHAEEACQLSLYAGMSAKLQLAGFFNYLPDRDQNQTTARLMAQLVWHYIRGTYEQSPENPLTHPEDFREYIVRINETELPLIFYYSFKTERWWMKTGSPNPQSDQLIACTQADYKTASRGEIPDRWWKNL